MTSFASALPAPATFAPSREDVLSTLAFFFGDPAVPEKLRDYSEHRERTAHRRFRAWPPHHTPFPTPALRSQMR